MKRSVIGMLAVITTALGAAPAEAQETGTPVFKAPYRAFKEHEFGADLSAPGGNLSYALEGFYRFGYEAFDIGVRGGGTQIENGGANPRGGGGGGPAAGGGLNGEISFCWGGGAGVWFSPRGGPGQ